MIKTELRGRLVGILLIALIVTSVFSGAVASENLSSTASLLENSGFESGVLYPWDYEHSSPSGPDSWVAIGVDDLHPYEGQYGAYIDINSAENEWGRIIQEIEITPGERLTLEAELMYELYLENGYAKLYLVFLDNDRNRVDSVHQKYYKSDFGDKYNWIHVALPTTTAPFNAKYAKVMVELVDVENCILNIDNVILQSDRGSLTVNVENAADKPMPTCGGTIEVLLYDKNWILIETKSEPYSGGESSVQVQFDNLANDDYFIEVYQTSNTGLGLEEYWGGDTVTVSGPTPKDFERHTQVAYDVTINGKSPYENEIEVNAGEQVHVVATVKNFEGGAPSKNVKAQLILDRDNSSSYDFDETHGPISIPQNGVGYFDYYFYPEETGTYYFYIVVKGEYSSKYIVVDQHDWYKAFKVPSGSLTVNVENAEGQPMPSCGGTVDVKLYDPFQVRSKTYSGGESSVQVQFDNLENKQYPIEVYQTPNTGLGLEEYWGGDTVTVSGSTTTNLVRHTQVAYDVTINGKSPYENEIEVNAGEQLHVDVTVKNFEGGVPSKNVKARLILDRDNSSSYDFDETHGPVSIPQNDVEVFGYDFYPEEAGTYYFYIVVYGEYNSKYIVVDQHDWYKAFESANSPPVLSEPDPGGINNNGTINLLSGTTSTAFIFSVIYTDVDNDVPYRHKLKLKRTDPNLKYFFYDMSTSDSNPDYTAGVLYTNTTTLEPGTYEYWFDFKDDYNPDVLLPPNYNYQGPTVIPEAAWISILDIAPSDTTPDPRETITLSVSTSNDGADGSADIGMTVIDPSGDECDLQWKEGEYYTAGQSKTLYFSYEVPSEAGRYDVISKSWDDCYGDCGSEQCCDPNTCSCSGLQHGLAKTNEFKVEIPEGPDLTLSSGDISFSNFNPSVGESITITAVIHNRGNADAHAVIVQFFDGDPDNGGTQIDDDQVIDLIAVGESRIVQIDWTFTSITNVYVVVDPDNDITELDEGNNIANRVVSGALSPEANLDILLKLASYYEESESYVSDNWDTAAKLCDISLTDKERQEILNELAREFPQLDLSEEEIAEEITNYQHYINNVINEGQTVTFTKTSEGTLVNDNGVERLLENTEIPFDKIELKTSLGKCVMTVDVSEDTKFSMMLEPFCDLGGCGIEMNYDLYVSGISASLTSAIFVGPGLTIITPGMYVELSIETNDHTITIFLNDPITLKNAEASAGVYVGYDLSGYTPAFVGGGGGVDVGPFVSYTPTDTDPVKVVEGAIEVAETLSDGLSDLGDPKADTVEVAVGTGLEVIEHVSNSLPPSANVGVEVGAHGKLGLGQGAKVGGGGVKASVDGLGAVSSSTKMPLNIYGAVISTNKEELATFFSSSTKASPILVEVYDVSQHPDIFRFFEVCTKLPNLAGYFWTAFNSAKEIDISEDNTKSVMVGLDLGVGIGGEIVGSIFDVGGEGQLSAEAETNLKTLIAAFTLDTSTLWDTGYFGGMIKEGADVSGGAGAVGGPGVDVKVGLSKELFKISVQGNGGKSSAFQVKSLEEQSAVDVSVISDHGIDINGDGLYDYLAVDVCLNVSTSDNYALGGMLFKNLTCVGSVVNTTYRDAGQHNITLKFDGIHLRNQKINGSYEFGAVLGLESKNDTLFISFSLYNTSYYNYTDFQKSYLNITNLSCSGIDTEGDGLYDYLNVEINLNSTKEGKANAIGILMSENLVLENETSSNLSSGVSTLELLFDGKELRSGGSNAYNLCITVYNEKGVILDSASRDIVLSYQHFELPNATLSDSYADRAVDADDDGLYDYLAIDVGVNVSVPGKYTVDAYLEGNRTAFYIYNSTFLESDDLLTLDVDGLTLRNTLKNQNHSLVNVRLYQNNTLLAVRTNPYNTSIYNYNSFELPKATLTNNYSDHGVDIDSDGLYDYLGIDVELNVTKPDVYKISGFLKCNQSSVSAEKQISLEAGNHTATLLFDGEEIYSKGYNGKYQLEGVRIIQNGEYLDYMNETYNTSIYNYTDFEKTGSDFDHDGDGIVRGDLDDLRSQYNAYIGIIVGDESEYDHNGNGVVRGDLDDLRRQYNAYIGLGGM